MLEKKSFAMSQFVSKADLYKAKATHYEEQAEKLQMELVVAQNQTAYLERVLLETARKLERSEQQLEQRDRDLML